MFRDLIEPGYQVIKVVTDEKALLSVAAQMKPDVVLMDMDMLLLNGSEAGLELPRLLPKTKVILLAMNDDPDVASKKLCQWPSGYLLKKSLRCRAQASYRRSLARPFLCDPALHRR